MYNFFEKDVSGSLSGKEHYHNVIGGYVEHVLHVTGVFELKNFGSPMKWIDFTDEEMIFSTP